jgi:hypothetical protein
VFKLVHDRVKGKWAHLRESKSKTRLFSLIDQWWNRREKSLFSEKVNSSCSEECLLEVELFRQMPFVEKRKRIELIECTVSCQVEAEYWPDTSHRFSPTDFSTSRNSIWGCGTWILYIISHQGSIRSQLRDVRDTYIPVLLRCSHQADISAQWRDNCPEECLLSRKESESSWSNIHYLVKLKRNTDRILLNDSHRSWFE